MPFKSKAQRRLFWAKVGRGEISKEKAEEWEHETPNKGKLPEKVKQPKAKPKPAARPKTKRRAKG
jgi:hypothetical protein